jgi:hypothetical protein
MPPTPFTPEIPHARVTFDRVRVAAADVLPGDGYERYLKPFRTIEDVHVHGAVTAWVLAVGCRSGWPEDAREALVGVLVGARAVALADPALRETHLALAGVLACGRLALEATRPHWALVDAPTRAIWERDAALLQVASRARAARAQAAWQALTASG